MKSSAEARPGTREPEFCFGSFRLEADGTFYRGDAQIHLPPKELAALRLLLAHAGQIVTPAQLKEALWGDVHVTADSIPRCLSSLRARLEPEQYIQTIYKRGYRLSCRVQRAGSQGRCAVHLAIAPFAPGHNVPDHLGPGIAEELTTRLTACCPPWLCILARDSAFTLAGRGMTALQMGETLKADLVLTGTLLAMPTHYRLRAEMIRVEDGTQVWVEEMLARNHEVIDLEAQLAQRLMYRLGGDAAIVPHAFLNGPRSAGQTDAYEFFLRGHNEWQTPERHRMEEAMQKLMHATELDPSLIAAQIDLANVCMAQEFYGFLAPEVAATQIRHIARSVPGGMTSAPCLLPALGWIDFHVDRDLPRALEMFSASAHLPHDPWTTRLRVMFALSRHRFDEALQWMDAALLTDPYAPWLHARIAWAHHLAGEAARSLAQVEKSLSLFPDHEGSHLYGAMILAFHGQTQRAVRLAEELVRRMPYFDIGIAIHAYALACNGQRGEAYALLERLQWLGRERYVLRSFTPAAYAVLGDMETAISEMHTAADHRCPWFFQMLADPRLQSLRARPEFHELQSTLDQMEHSLSDSLEYQL